MFETRSVDDALGSVTVVVEKDDGGSEPLSDDRRKLLLKLVD